MAQCAAIGTASGSVHVIDLSKEDHPRVVHKVHLYHTPVDYLVYVSAAFYPPTNHCFNAQFLYVCMSTVRTVLTCLNRFELIFFSFLHCVQKRLNAHDSVWWLHRFDQGGNFLLATSDRFVHVLHAKPSEGFSVIGFTGVCAVWFCFTLFLNDMQVSCCLY